MLLIGIAVVAGAAFLAWMFLRRPGGSVATTSNPTGSALSSAFKPGTAASVLANTTLGIGAASFQYGLKGAELVADGALTLGKDAVDTSARLLSRTVNLGGTVVTDAGKVSSSIITTGGKVVQAGIGLPVKVVSVQVKAVENVAAGAVGVTKDLAGGAANVGKKVGGTVLSAVKSFGSLF